MIKFLYIGIGGATGAILRYLVSGLTYRFFSEGFPWGTLAVNLIGCLIIGFLWGLFETITVSQNLKFLVLIGLLGSFTTFSTFSLENFNMLRDGQNLYFFLNVLISVVLGLLLVFAGNFLSRFALGFWK